MLGSPGPPRGQGAHTASPSVLTEAPTGLAGGGEAEGKRGQHRGLGQRGRQVGWCAAGLRGMLAG